MLDYTNPADLVLVISMGCALIIVAVIFFRDMFDVRRIPKRNKERYVLDENDFREILLELEQEKKNGSGL